MKTIVSLIVCYLILQISANAQTALPTKKPASPITLSDELIPLYDISTLPLYRDNTIEMQISTYDPTGGNDDGFDGTYSFVRRNADSSLVIFDVKGCGVINRIWTPTPTEDTLDFFIDDTARATLSIKYSDLFSGKVFPFVAPLAGSRLGGNYCYFPILFQHRCQIVCRGKKMQFHQIQYRLYPEGTMAKRFNPFLNQEETAAILGIGNLWDRGVRRLQDYYEANLNKASLTTKIESATSSVELYSDETKTVFNIPEGGRILGIEMDPANAFAGVNKDIDIRITWDNETNPGVYCPVADFFGYAFGQPSMHSLLLGTQGNRNYCYFPMPFDQSARIELINRSIAPSKEPVRCNLKVYYNTVKRNPESEGRFYAYWKSNRLSTNDPMHVLLQATGRGHYVGTLLQAQGLIPGMTFFFEGDDSTATDGHFRIHGTGSEDYFNGGWYACPDRWDSRQSLPIHGALEYSLPFCRTGGYRFYLSDKIPFENNIFQSIEHGSSAKGVPADYTSVSFYYCDRGAEGAKPTNELSRVYEPDTLMIYPQLMSYTIWGSINLKNIGMYPIGGRSCIYSADDLSRLKISLGGIPGGKYSLFADLVKYAGGCSFAIWQGQTRVSEWINTNQADTQRIKILSICDLDTRNLPESLNSVTLKFKTGSDKNSLFLNRFILVKKKGD